MRAIMKRASALLALALLSACQNLLPNATDHGTAPPKVSQQAGAVQAKSEAAPKTSGQQATPDGAKSGATGVTTSAEGEAPGSASAPLLNPPVDRTKKLEYADVYVDLKNPQGQKALVPYLMKPEEWTIVKVEHISATYKHYRFQRVASNDGKPIPEVDPLKPPKPSGTP
jgi:hypothetical protein